MGKQNLTVQLDSETVRRAEVIAAERGLSMNALVSQLLEQLAAADDRDEGARKAGLGRMADVGRHTSELDHAAEGLSRTWIREEFYDEHLEWQRTHNASS